MKTLYIISGRPCSGKTSMTYRLSEAYKVHPEHLDVFAAEIVNKSDHRTPEIFKWKGWDLVPILSKEPNVLFQEYIDFYDELLPFVAKYLQHREEDKIILESAFFLPKHIKTLSKDFNIKTIFIETSDSFVREKYVKRDYAIAMTKEKGGINALENLLKRDALFVTYMYNQARLEGFEILKIEEEDDFDCYYYQISQEWFEA